LGGGGNDAVKNTNINEIQILFAGYHKPAKLGKPFAIALKVIRDPIASCNKIFDSRLQYPFISRIFPNFVCGALFPFCKLQKGI
jgi:hypothetical protein